MSTTRPAAALGAYDRASELAPWESRYPALAGQVAAQGLRQPERALARYRRAVAREPRALGNALNLARLASAQRREALAERAWRDVLAIDATTPEVLLLVAQEALRQGEVQRAQRLLERAVAVREQDARLWVALGQARLADRSLEEARAAFRTALRLEPAVDGGREGLDSVEQLT